MKARWATQKREGTDKIGAAKCLSQKGKASPYRRRNGDERHTQGRRSVVNIRLERRADRHVETAGAGRKSRTPLLGEIKVMGA